MAQFGEYREGGAHAVSNIRLIPFGTPFAQPAISRYCAPAGRVGSYAAVTDRKQPLREKDIVCLGHLRRVFALLDGLDGVGRERDTAGNRELSFPAYCKLVLLYV